MQAYENLTIEAVDFRDFLFSVKVDDFGCQVSFQNENLSQTASVHQQTTHRNI